jgi:hypothetical protein
MINGRTYDWESIKVDAPFGIDVEIQNINYQSTREGVAVYGRGNAPRGYGRQNLEQDGSVQLNGRSFIALSAYGALAGGILRIAPFPITVRYANTDQPTQVDILDGVIFTGVSTEASQGDEEILLRTLNIRILNPIKWNSVPVM